MLLKDCIIFLKQAPLSSFAEIKTRTKYPLVVQKDILIQKKKQQYTVMHGKMLQKSYKDARTYM